LGASGQATTQVLLGRGTEVIGVDDAIPGAVHSSSLELTDLDLLVVSPGWPPDAPLVRRAQAAGAPVISEVELAWRLRANRSANWLTLTGTNGKTTTVLMLESMLKAAGRAAVAAGNVGNPLVSAVQDPAMTDFAVELSSFQLHHTHSLQPVAAAVLNLAPDHLDWHGSWEAYLAAKARVYSGVQRAIVFNLNEPLVVEMTQQAEAGSEVARVGFTLDQPGQGELGLVDGSLIDRAFGGADPRELATQADLAHLSTNPHAIPPHLVANALAAAGLALAAGIEPDSVRSGLRAFNLGAHRLEAVAEVGGVRYIDDSKATNPHAAAAALRGFGDGQVVWIAGGLAKGLRFDELVASHGHKLKAAVLIGVDQALLVQALEQHAPGLPRYQVMGDQTGSVMEAAVRQAAKLAERGEVVLLSPAAASMDQFANYQMRGQAFAEAVRRLEE